MARPIKSSSFRKSTPTNPYEGCLGLVYVRVSGKKQETQGYGRESQEGRCKADLASISVPFVKTFPDTYTGGVTL